MFCFVRTPHLREEQGGRGEGTEEAEDNFEVLHEDDFIDKWIMFFLVGASL